MNSATRVRTRLIPQFQQESWQACGLVGLALAGLVGGVVMAIAFVLFFLPVAAGIELQDAARRDPLGPVGRLVRIIPKRLRAVFSRH